MKKRVSASLDTMNPVYSIGPSLKLLVVLLWNAVLMINKIEVFVRNEEGVVGQAIIGRPIVDGVTTHYCTAKETMKTEKVMSQADAQVLTIVREFASSRNLRVQVYDVLQLKGKLKASMKRIKTTPAVLVGNCRFEGADLIEALRNKLELLLNQ